MNGKMYYVNIRIIEVYMGGMRKNLISSVFLI